MFNRRNLRPFDLAEASRFKNADIGTFRITARNAKGSDPAQLFIDDSVGESYDGGGITAKDVSAFLADNKNKPIDVRINSPGGSIFCGLQIYNGLIDHGGFVTVTIVGVAASIASVIAQAGDKRLAFSNSNLMVHRALCACVGNRADMADCVTWLDKLDQQLAGIYSDRSGQAKSTMLGFMIGPVDGTLFTAQEALDARLIDAIIPNNGGTRNAASCGPSGIDSRLQKIRDDARRSQRSAEAQRRVRELQRDVATV